MNIKSKKVYTETYSYTSIPLSEHYSNEEYNDAYAELNVFRKNYYGESLIDAPGIELFITEHGSSTLRFATMYELSGKGFNSLMYPDAVDARDLM
jgi:hypothetical protein